MFPYPLSDDAEQDKVRSLIASAREFAAESIDVAKIEEQGWIGDDVVRGLGERGLCGLYVPEQYGGQGLSQTGYCRVFEAFSQVDASLSVVMGVHQSIGMKGIVMFGSDEQKQRLLPDLASGRKLAAFALTEPEAGSDAYHLQSRAVLQSDGSWLLNGEKRYIGNGSKAGVIVTFARAEVDGKDRHGPAGERARGARRRLPDRDGGAQQRPYEPRHGVGRRRQEVPRRGDRARHDPPAVRPPARRVRARAGEDRLDGLVPVRPGVDGLHDHGPGRRGCSGLFARVGDLQSRRNRVSLVPGQPRVAVGRGRGLSARPPL